MSGDQVVAKSLAKELLRSRKAKERLYKNKAHLNSVCMSLRQHMGKSSEFKLDI
jgi:division protein CdvB (Snf7/Vps24/ESCRT-III family)